MGMQLLTTAGASVTGKWAHVEPAKSVDYPVRVSIIGSFTGGNVILEELIGGVPGNGTGSPYPPQADTGTVVQIGTYAVAQDVIIDAPMDYIRARTDGNITGGTTASVYLTMGS